MTRKTLRPIISWQDNPLYVETGARLKKAGRLPEGSFSVGIVLQEGWNSEWLAWHLNSLFGGTFADEPYRTNSGARAFSFQGDRAGEAHQLCDVLRDGWFGRADTDQNIVLTMGETGDSMDDLIESVLLTSLAPSYLDTWKYSLFVVPDDSSAAIVQDAIRAFEASWKAADMRL